MLQDLRLSPENAVQIAEKFQMRMADSCVNHDIRSYNRAEAVHFSEMVDAHLQHRQLMILLNGRQRERNPDQIVFVPLRFMHAEVLPENGGNHFFPGSFPDGTGNPDHRNGEPASESRHQLLQRLLHILADNDRSLGTLRNVLGKRAGSAAAQSGGNIIMSVCLFPSIGGKKASGCNLAAIDFNSGQLAVTVRHCINRAAADCGGPGNSHIKHVC